jgi:dethiobiotin synthetase
VVAACFARTAMAAGERVAVFKPAVSGLDEYPTEEGVPPDHELLRIASGSRQSDDEIAPYRYCPPVSPHLAAVWAGEKIDPGRVRRAASAAGDKTDLLVCEGVGGFLVPLTPGYLVRDLARELALPVAIAASPALGTINHTLLTIDSVRAAGLSPELVVLTPWPETPSEMERSNRETIERLGSIPVQTLPRLDLDAPESWPALALPSRARLRAA